MTLVAEFRDGEGPAETARREPAASTGVSGAARKGPAQQQGESARTAPAGVTANRLALVTGLVLVGVLASYIHGTLADITEPVSLIRSIEIEAR